MLFVVTIHSVIEHPKKICQMVVLARVNLSCHTAASTRDRRFFSRGYHDAWVIGVTSDSKSFPGWEPFLTRRRLLIADAKTSDGIRLSMIKPSRRSSGADFTGGNRCRRRAGIGEKGTKILVFHMPPLLLEFCCKDPFRPDGTSDSQSGYNRYIRSTLLH